MNTGTEVAALAHNPLCEDIPSHPLRPSDDLTTSQDPLPPETSPSAAVNNVPMIDPPPTSKDPALTRGLRLDSGVAAFPPIPTANDKHELQIEEDLAKELATLQTQEAVASRNGGVTATARVKSKALPEPRVPTLRGEREESGKTTKCTADLNLNLNSNPEGTDSHRHTLAATAAPAEGNAKDILLRIGLQRKNRKLFHILNCSTKDCFLCNSKRSPRAVIRQNLNKKYLTTRDSYNAKVINDIIYNENTHIVSVFKDHLIMDDVSEFLKRFYAAHESTQRLPKVYDFYDKYSKVFPNYIALPESKLMFKNIERKQRLIDEQQKNETVMRKKKGTKKPRNPSEASQKLLDTEFIRQLEASKHEPSRLQAYLHNQSKCAPKPETSRLEDLNMQQLIDRFIAKDSQSLIDVGVALKTGDFESEAPIHIEPLIKPKELSSRAAIHVRAKSEAKPDPFLPADFHPLFTDPHSNMFLPRSGQPQNQLQGQGQCHGQDLGPAFKLGLGFELGLELELEREREQEQEQELEKASKKEEPRDSQHNPMEGKVSRNMEAGAGLRSHKTALEQWASPGKKFPPDVHVRPVPAGLFAKHCPTQANPQTVATMAGSIFLVRNF